MIGKLKIVPTPRTGRALKRLILGVTCVSVMAGVACAQDIVGLKIRNNLEFGNGSFDANIAVKSNRPLNPSNAWATLKVPAGRVTTLNLASPDTFVVRATADGVTYESEAVPLKQWVKDNPDYELNLDAIMSAPSGQRSETKLGLSFSTPRDTPGPGDRKEIAFRRIGGGAPAGRVIENLRRRLGR
jgi:hypothetical protein